MVRVRIRVRFGVMFRVRVRVRPFSHSREVRFWTRPSLRHLQSTLTTPAQCFSSLQRYNKKRKNSTQANQSRSNDRICPDFDAFSGCPRPNPSLNCVHQLRRTLPCRFLLDKCPSRGVRPMWSGTHRRLGPMNLGSALQTAGQQDPQHT